MENNDLLSTREVAEFLKINEKMVYNLISEKGLPGTKVTGKWLFPKRLVEKWLENSTVNYPKTHETLPPYHGLLIIAGSNDILLDRTLPLFNNMHEEHVVVFGNLGSMGGIQAMRRGLCHMASSHLLQEKGDEYNFDFAAEELGELPAVVNFCKREQGILLSKGNPKQIQSVADLAGPGVRIANRPKGTGTRLLLDREIKRRGLEGRRIEGYSKEFPRHLDVGLEVLAGRAHAAPGIRAVAGLLGLDFLPLRWERFDFLIQKDRFFDPGIQLFLGMLHDSLFRDSAKELEGYDLEICGKMIFPQG